MKKSEISPKAPTTKGNNKEMIIKTLTSNKFLLVLLVVMQALMLVFVIRNEVIMVMNNNNRYSEIVNKLAKLEVLNPGTQVVVQPLEDVDALRNENEIQKEIYKDAQNGDYAIIMPDNKLVIYRESENRIIYNDVTPSAKLQDIQVGQLNDLRKAAIEAAIIASDSQTIPQVSVVQEPEKVLQQDPEFYKNVALGDFVALFPAEGKIVLYRPATKGIIASGQVRTSIER